MRAMPLRLWLKVSDMAILPPGTLLRLIYLREHFGQITPGRFIQVGPGSGEITKLLLDLGWRGQSCDLDALTIKSLQMRFAHEINEGRYSAIRADYLTLPHLPEKVDLVISYWGIEDDIAGHGRRYTFRSLQKLMVNSGWKAGYLAGLTFPISNLLLPISNFLVNRRERSKPSLSAPEKTKSPGRRSVKFKTHFPSLTGLILNRHVLLTLHFLQKAFKNSWRSPVIYFEQRSNPGAQSE